MRDILTDEQRRERKNLAAILVHYLPDAALDLLPQVHRNLHSYLLGHFKEVPKTKQNFLV